MGSLHVVFLKPVFRGISCFSNRFKEPAVQATVSKDAVERLVMSVLPRTSRLDETYSDAPILDPSLDLLRNELRSVVALERLVMSVRPQASGLDEKNADSLIFDPFLDLLRNELSGKPKEPVPAG